MVSSDLKHIPVDYFRANILPQIILSSGFRQAQGVRDPDELDQHATTHREKIVSSEIGGCYLTVFSEFQEDETIAEPNRQIGPYIIAVLNASGPTTSQRSHRNIVNAAISAFAVSTRNMDRVEKIFDATYRIHNEHVVIYCSLSGHLEGRIISQFPDNFDQDFRIISERFTDNQNLSSVFRLLAASYTQYSDKLASFLAAWSALEIFVNKSFPSQEMKFFASLESLHADFVSRLQEIMKDKYRLTDKFALLSSTILADTAADDIKTFKDLKKLRDELLHGGEIETNRLPIESIQTLLRRYLLVYINAVQT